MPSRPWRGGGRRKSARQRPPARSERSRKPASRSKRLPRGNAGCSRPTRWRFKNAILAVPIAEAARLTRAALEGGERAVETELDAIARQLLTELAGGADDA